MSRLDKYESWPRAAPLALSVAVAGSLPLGKKKPAEAGLPKLFSS
jgi:hypothetical protein